MCPVSETASSHPSDADSVVKPENDSAAPEDSATPQGSAPLEDDAQDDSVFRVHLENYEGPVGLLLDLIRRHKIDIYDIPIAQITDQYLDFLRRADELNINLGGEFVFMAATLIQIKSKMLLPRDPTIPEHQLEDPREELVQKLVEHETFKQASQMLREKRLVEESTWSNPPLQAFVEEDEDPGLAVSVFDLVKTFQDVLERAKNRPSYEVPGGDVSVESRIAYLKNLLLSEDEPVLLREVFERQPSRRALVATFLAVLEMVRMQAILLRQNKLFDEIVIRKHKMFDLVFSSDQPLLAAEGDYQE